MSKPICASVGAGEGLGRSLAAKFAGEGFDIGLISRSEEGSRAAIDAAVTARASTKTRHFPADATQPSSIEKAMGILVDVFGDVDLLIYNVCDGVPRCEPLDMDYDEMERVFRLEVVGAFAATKSVLPAMRQRGSGRIFFSSATAALRGSASIERFPNALGPHSILPWNHPTTSPAAIALAVCTQSSSGSSMYENWIPRPLSSGLRPASN